MGESVDVLVIGSEGDAELVSVDPAAEPWRGLVRDVSTETVLLPGEVGAVIVGAYSATDQPVNPTATRLVDVIHADLGAPALSGPLHGPVVVAGLDEEGEWAELPAAVTAAATRLELSLGT